MNGGAILAVTSHGNAPYLMAARLAIALGNHPVVIPLYYGDVQRQIMQKELGGATANIHLSAELGNLMKPLLLDKSTGMSFVDFAERLADKGNPQGVMAIEAQINDLLRAGISTEGLGDGVCRTFTRDDFCLAVNLAQPLLVDLPVQAYVFTGLLSRVYGQLPPGVGDDESLGLVERQQGYARLWARAEQGSNIRLVPRIHACSYDSAQLPGVTPIPPLAVRRPQSRELKQPGVLFSPSGTGTDTGKLVSLARDLPEQWKVYLLAGGPVVADFDQIGAHSVDGSVYGDPQIEWIAARGGWGTIWECLMNEKPPVLVQTTFAEDPEMGHTQTALRNMGLARILDGRERDIPSAGEIIEIRSRIQTERAADRSAFGELANDGYAYLAMKLNEYLDEHQPRRMRSL